MTTTTTDNNHAHRETADLRGNAAANEAALARYERVAGKLRCDVCGEIASLVTIHRKGQRNSFAGLCSAHQPVANTTAARRIQVALAERAIQENN